MLSASVSAAWTPGSSSHSIETQHWRLKYSLGGRVRSGASTAPRHSMCSSIRQRSQGAQPQLPSRKATRRPGWRSRTPRSEEHTSELQSLAYLVCRLLLEKKKKKKSTTLSLHFHT